jgi:hypothetical protein
MMHGPKGASHPNESVFREIEPDTRLVIEHVVTPWYTLTVTLAPRDHQTRVPGPRSSRPPKPRHTVEPANEQNFDRVEAMLAEDSA